MMGRILLAIVIFCCFALSLFYVSTVVDVEPLQCKSILVSGQQRHANWLSQRSIKGKSITPLGNWLLSPEGTSPPEKNKNNHIDDRAYLILIWQYGPILERRHIRRYSNKKFSPWDSCSVQNCKLTYESNDLHNADAVIFHLQDTPEVRSLPQRKNLNQRWIFSTDESPWHTFIYRNQSIDEYDGLFNWSMTYRIDSDVPVPYGRTVLRRTQDESLDVGRIFSGKKTLVAVLGSNCYPVNKRWEYVDKLKSLLGNHLKIFGHCHPSGDLSTCPGHFDRDCPSLGEFKFYLAFENSNCREYITEKVFWNAYSKFSVPIVMGARKADYQLLLPPRSYLHVDDFADPNSLADYLHYLNENDDEYSCYHQWRVNYRTIDEHAYFGSASKHYCRVCEALNYNNPNVKIYQRLHDFWSIRNDCVIP